MIAQQNFGTYPVFGDNATKVQPDANKYSAGFQEADVLPSEWMNWAWNKNSKGITDLNLGVSVIEKELINLLSAAGITPVQATENQVATAVEQLIAAKTGALSNLTTTAKTSLVAAINENKAAIDTKSPKAGSADLTTFSGGTFGAAAAKGVDTAVTAGSANLPTSGAVNNALSSYVPTGTVQHGFYLTEPEGWLFCNGQSLLRSQYPALWNLLKDIDECQGDGSTTFTTPDLRECVIVGAGTSTRTAIITHDVYALGEFKDDQLQVHTHSYTCSNNNNKANYDGGGRDGNLNTGVYGTNTGSNTGRSGSTTHGKQFGMNYIIKY